MNVIPTSLSKATDRTRMAAALIEAAVSRGWKVGRDHRYGRRRSLTLRGPKLAVLVALDGAWGHEVPLLHWHGAAHKIAWKPEAWQSINQFHGHKATSFAQSLEQLLAMLQVGIDAANDGSAFRGGEA